MSYAIQAVMAQDNDLTERVAAAAAEQGWYNNPRGWATRNQWQIVSKTDWVTAYSAAVQAGRGAPGHDNDIITDSMILASVQPLVLEDLAELGPVEGEVVT
jgi:hypothetical protein